MSSQRLATHFADAEHHDSSGTHHNRRVIGSCASIGEAFRALPLEAHFASVRSRVCVAVAHRHAPDHFDVVLAVAAMLYAVLRQCACKLHRVRSQQDGRGHREIESCRLSPNGSVEHTF